LNEVESVYTPAIAVCLPFLDIMSSTVNGVNLKTERHSTEEILQLTPDADLALEKCSYRDDFGMELQEYSFDDCIKWFAADKFILSDFVCYRLQRRESKNISLLRIVSSLHDSTEIYSFSMATVFKKADFIKIIVWSTELPIDHPDAFPYYSRTYASVLRRLANNETKEAFTNSYTTRYSWYQMYLLPAPYDTMCTPTSSKQYCVQGCTVKKFVDLERTPPTEIITKPSKLIHFSSEDYKDENIMNETLKIRDECDGQCKRLSCYYDYSVAVTSAYLDKKSPHMTFRLSSPTSPTTIVSSLISLDFTGFLIYVTSCFGTWFGISIIAMNPLHIGFVQNLIHKRSDKRMKEEKATKAGYKASGKDLKMSRKNNFPHEGSQNNNSNSHTDNGIHSLWTHYPYQEQLSP
jgi:hypothetical protein